MFYYNTPARAKGGWLRQQVLNRPVQVLAQEGQDTLKRTGNGRVIGVRVETIYEWAYDSWPLQVLLRPLDAQLRQPGVGGHSLLVPSQHGIVQFLGVGQFLGVDDDAC